MADFLRLTDYRTGEGRVVNRTDIMLAAPHHMGCRLTLRADVLVECKEPFEDIAAMLGASPVLSPASDEAAVKAEHKATKSEPEQGKK